MSYITCITLIIFLITYAFIISERVNRTIIALVGASLMIFIGVVDQKEAIAYIDFNTITLLIGMMIQVYILSKTGLFTYLAIWAAQRTKGNPKALFLLLCIIVAISSALLDNVTTVLLTIPVSLALAQDLRINPKPFVYAQIMAANIGGTATMIGDPPNIMIGSAVKELNFMSFVTTLAPICVVIFVITIAILLFIYRKELCNKPEDRVRIMKIKLAPLIRAPKLLVKCGISMGFTIVLFSMHGQIPGWSVDSGAVAMAAASMLMLISIPHKNQFVEKIFSNIEWGTIFFFAGLFVLVGALESQGIINWLAETSMSLTGGDHTKTTFTILGLSAVMSAFVDNIPFVATMIPLIQDIQAMGYSDIYPLWWALALGACLGGNGTIIGASANVIAVAMARKQGMEITFFGYMKLAFPLMLMSILISAVYLWFKFL